MCRRSSCPCGMRHSRSARPAGRSRDWSLRAHGEPRPSVRIVDRRAEISSCASVSRASWVTRMAWYASAAPRIRPGTEMEFPARPRGYPEPASRSRSCTAAEPSGASQRECCSIRSVRYGCIRTRSRSPAPSGPGQLSQLTVEALVFLQVLARSGAADVVILRRSVTVVRPPAELVRVPGPWPG